MFEPTIKYRRVNDSPSQGDILKSLDELNITNDKKDEITIAVTNEKKSVTTQAKEQESKVEEDSSKKEKEVTKKPTTTTAETTNNDTSSVKTEPDYTFEEEEDDCKIEVDPNDKERIIVTLSTGKQFSADRYCPHAGADLSYHGKVSEHDYPPEIGPILMCPIHYWEFALEKNGKGGGGWATINACPIDVAEKCASSAEKKKLEW
jgi:nitrite reductase/ring-hydroxylating ferredoxin subunit